MKEHKSECNMIRNEGMGCAVMHTPGYACDFNSCTCPFTSQEEKEPNERTCCKDCGLPYMNGIDHVCDEQGLKRRQEFLLDPTKTSDWKEREREAFDEWRQEFRDNQDRDPSYPRCMDFWLSRIETLIQEEVARVDNSGRKLYQLGVEAGKKEYMEAQKKLDNSGLFEEYIDPYVQKKVSEERDRLIALAEGIAKKGGVKEVDKRHYNQALFDFIAKAKSE